eukprot:scaffold1424_cov111-Isochrysis_galbana.AAC.3
MAAANAVRGGGRARARLRRPSLVSLPLQGPLHGVSSAVLVGVKTVCADAQHKNKTRSGNTKTPHPSLPVQQRRRSNAASPSGPDPPLLAWHKVRGKPSPTAQSSVAPFEPA